MKKLGIVPNALSEDNKPNRDTSDTPDSSRMLPPPLDASSEE
jgi:hypothetical protein